MNNRRRTLSAQAIRALRPPHTSPDPWRPLAYQGERERQLDGTAIEALTVFLVGRECPFTCVFCDLWRYTISDNTPAGALPAQLRQALAAAGPLPPSALLKLYNASNFFDTKAVPPGDHDALAKLTAPFARVVVECHAKLVGVPCYRFAEALEGRLEVAIGLETVHPEALPRLGKSMTLSDFADAAERLAAHDIGLRVFVQIGAPYVVPEEDATEVARAMTFAFEHGAEHVALIPTRGGNGALEHLAARGEWTPPTLASVEQALDVCLAASPAGVVTVDPWNLTALGDCNRCRASRVARIERMNRSGSPESAVVCDTCGHPGPPAVAQSRP